MLMVRNGQSCYLNMIHGIRICNMCLTDLQNIEHQVSNAKSFKTYACILGKQFTNSCSNPSMERNKIHRKASYLPWIYQYQMLEFLTNR